MHERVHIFGIRHHGPGSAASLLAALDALDPAAVLIEAPIDVEAALPLAADAGMKPPVALLVHNKKDPARALFHPFAEYSPEWQAMRWAFARGRSVRAIDLAAGNELHLEPESNDGDSEQEDQAAPVPEKHDDRSAVRRDPLSALARAVGHSDGEAWWNAIVEQSVAPGEVFAAITSAMAELRAEPSAALDPDDQKQRHELQREAHMRERVRDALQEIDGELAVVVGAWHAPVIASHFTRKDDRALLRGLRPAKVEATWVPWTDTRLARASGYGAGVLSPGWYRHLWQCFTAGNKVVGGVESAVRWQTATSHLLRDEGLPAATASTIEAARLATCLAALRGHSVPGLAEMQDASLAALCHGEVAPMQLIAQRLVIGQRIGEIGDGVPQMALAADLQRLQKRVRLKPEAVEKSIALDLRTETGLAKSTLLHRLLLIEVPWGRLLDANAGRGTFREVWEIVWQPELSVQLAEALRWGTTVETAAQNAAIDKASRSDRVVEIAQVVELCLLADLEQAAQVTIARLQAACASSSDIGSLMEAATPLASVLRYGTARQLPVEALTALVGAIVVEVVAGLVHACRSLDADATEAMQQRLSAFDRAVDMLGDDDLMQTWLRSVGQLGDDEQAMPLLLGWATRCQYDRDALTAEAVQLAMSRALSPSVAIAQAGDWLLGFLSDGAQLLLHDRDLLAVIDGWVAEPGEETFVELLPVLRRAFAGLQASERQRLMRQLAASNAAGAVATMTRFEEELPSAYQQSLPLLHRLLGLEDA